jgi:hypothetical protein
MKITYETKTCGRCGGSGHYSYNQMSGTRCFGCSGHKTVLTAAGKRAQLAVDAFKLEHFSKLAADLVAGDRIIVENRFVRTITAVEVSGSYCSSSDASGETVKTHYIEITLDREYPTPFGKCGSVNTFPTQRMQLAVTGENWDRVVEFARSIRKGVTIVTTPVGVTA